jgi:glycerol-3-phosphate dehydrogenase (NAD(P)+)
MTSVAIFGAGAWGTALAVHLAQRASVNPHVTLYARNADHATAMAASRENARYLPQVPLPESLVVTSALADATQSDFLIAATPVAALPGLARELKAAGARAPLFWVSKGFVSDPALPAGVGLAHQLLSPLWPSSVGIVSGPTFAEEIARGLPAALTVAATTPALATGMATLLRGDTLRAYETDDLAGVEVGGAVKNILAIAAGASDGLAFGHNARAALITRGLAETGRLLTALGGRRETLMGLAGLGDLVLTCTGDLSRNRRVGLGLAQGKSLPTILGELGHVAEGVTAAVAVRALAAHHEVEMPICDAVYRVLHEGLPAQLAVAGLLQREPRSERV